MIRVVYYFTKMREIKSSRGREKRKEEQKVLLGKSSTKKPGTAVLLNCTVHTNHQMLVKMQTNNKNAFLISSQVMVLLVHG